MPLPIDPADVEAVRQAADIAAVVGDRVELRPKGRELVGLCPFHADSRPSLTVNPAKGLYHCFTCGAGSEGGDAIRFVQDFDRCSFLEAVRHLADRFGVAIADRGSAAAADPEEVKARQAELEARAAERARDLEAERRRRVSAAGEAWRSATAPSIARGYLAARLGIDPGELPAIPESSISGAERCPDLVGPEDLGGPAVLGALVNARGVATGVQRIFLDPEALAAGEIRKRPESAKKSLGVLSGAAVRLAEPTSGRLIVTEGIETAAACLAACADAAGVWACLSTSGLRSIELPAGWVERKRIRKVIIAADLDRSDAGRQAALDCCARLLEQHPKGLEVAVALPRARYEAGPFAGVEIPWDKSIDWLDVYRALGPGRVRDELLDGAERFEDPGDGDGGDDDPPRPQPGGGSPAAPLIDPDILVMARRALLALFSPEQPTGERWRLARYVRTWLAYDPKGRRWVDVNDERLRSSVWHYLQRFSKRKANGETVPLRPTGRMIEDVLRAMVAETDVPGDRLPCWSASTFDDEGLPIPGSATNVVEGASAGRIRPESVIATRSGLLDAAALADGEVRLEPLTTRWISRTTIPVELPIAELRKALDDELAASELLGRLCPTWLEFIAGASAPGDGEVDETWVDALQEWFGYSLVADNSLETICLITGPTRSGKGTIRTGLEAIHGADSIAVTSLAKLPTRFGTAPLVGRLVALMPDAHVGGRFTDAVGAVELLKAISGGDPVAIDRKMSAELPNVTLACRFTIFANELPKLPDPSGALAARMLVLPTVTSHRGREDRTLKGRIRTEAQGILIWALLGLRRLRRQGRFTLVPRGVDELEEFRRLGAPVAAFVEDECVRGPDNEVETKLLYEQLVKWCDDNGHHAPAAERVGAMLKSAYPDIQRRGRQTEGRRFRVYTNLRPLCEGEAELDAEGELVNYGPRKVHAPEDLQRYGGLGSSLPG